MPFKSPGWQDKHLIETERKAWEQERKQQIEKEKLETKRFRITTAIAAIAALAAVIGIVLQFVLR